MKNKKRETKKKPVEISTGEVVGIFLANIPKLLPLAKAIANEILSDMQLASQVSIKVDDEKKPRSKRKSQGYRYDACKCGNRKLKISKLCSVCERKKRQKKPKKKK